MKALLLVESDRVADIASFYLRPMGFDVLRYRSPVKAVDNLEELDPDAIVISARDFPRHWKVLAQAARATRDKGSCVIVLLKGERFSFEEAAKAAQLGVNGVVRDDLDDRAEQSQFQRLLKRYVRVDESRASDRVAPASWDRIDFMFAHPGSLSPVAGRLETISPSGITFAPDSPSLVSDLEAGTAIEDCSLRAGDRLMSLSCRITRADRVLGLAITAMESPDRDYLVEYLAACPEREMDELLKKNQ